jgi:hypothetical protein
VDGRPVEVPQVPETELEIQRYEAALRRKQLSLVLAGKPSRRNRTKHYFFVKSFFLKLFYLKFKFTSKVFLQALKFNTKGSDQEFITL